MQIPPHRVSHGLHATALTALVASWLAWGAGLVVSSTHYGTLAEAPSERWSQAPADLSLMFPYGWASLFVLAYVPLAAMRLVPSAVTSLVSLLLAAHHVWHLHETVFQVHPGLQGPLTTAACLAGLAAVLGLGGALVRSRPEAPTSGATAAAKPEGRPSMGTLPPRYSPSARWAYLLVLAAWASIILVWMLAPRVHLPPERDIEPGHAFGIGVFVVIPFILATLWMIPTGIIGAAGRFHPLGIFVNGTILLVTCGGIWAEWPLMYDLVPALEPVLLIGMPLALLALVIAMADVAEALRTERRAW